MIVYSKAKGHQLLAYKHYEKDGLSQENLMPLKKQACEEFLPPPSFFFETHKPSKSLSHLSHRAAACLCRWGSITRNWYSTMTRSQNDQFDYFHINVRVI